jgi:hypothetical protein
MPPGQPPAAAIPRQTSKEFSMADHSKMRLGRKAIKTGSRTLALADLKAIV